MNARLFSSEMNDPSTTTALSSATASVDSTCGISTSSDCECTQSASHDNNDNRTQQTTTTTTTFHTSPDMTNLLQNMHDYHVIFHQRTQLIVYMVVITTYFGIVLTLLVANNQPQDYIETHYFLPFHFFEFFGALMFASIEAFLILGGSRQQQYKGSSSSSNGSRMNTLAVALTIFNVVTSAVACTLFTLCPELFEVPSHYIEYFSQVMVTLVDYFFLVQLSSAGAGSMRDEQQPTQPGKLSMLLMSGLLITAITKLFVYSEIIPTAMGGERSSHYIEFVGELLNCMLAFRFAAMQYFAMNQRLVRHQNTLSPPPMKDTVVETVGGGEGISTNDTSYGSVWTSSGEMSPLLAV